MANRPALRISKAPKDSAPIEVVEAEIVEEGEEIDLPMPSSVRIGCFEHAISDMDPMKSVSMNRIGEYDTLHLSIEILRQMPKQRLAETLMHEIFHGLWHVTGLRNDSNGPDEEEHAVTVLSMAMTQLIRDNPVLIAWMLQNLRND